MMLVEIIFLAHVIDVSFFIRSTSFAIGFRGIARVCVFYVVHKFNSYLVSKYNGLIFVEG